MAETEREKFEALYGKRGETQLPMSSWDAFFDVWQAARASLPSRLADAGKAIDGVIPEDGKDGGHIAKRIERWYVEGLYSRDLSACSYNELTLAERWWRRGCNSAVRIAASQDIEDVPELNLSNYNADDVDTLNDWAIRAHTILRDRASLPAPEFMHDDDGELLMDWSPAKGRMVTLSLRADGRLSYAIKWDDESSHGQAQMPSLPAPLPDETLRNLSEVIHGHTADLRSCASMLFSEFPALMPTGDELLKAAEELHDALDTALRARHGADTERARSDEKETSGVMGEELARQCLEALTLSSVTMKIASTKFLQGGKDSMRDRMEGTLATIADTLAALREAMEPKP